MIDRSAPWRSHSKLGEHFAEALNRDLCRFLAAAVASIVVVRIGSLVAAPGSAICDACLAAETVFRVTVVFVSFNISSCSALSRHIARLAAASSPVPLSAGRATWVARPRVLKVVPVHLLASAPCPAELWTASSATAGPLARVGLVVSLTSPAWFVVRRPGYQIAGAWLSPWWASGRA